LIKTKSAYHVISRKNAVFQTTSNNAYLWQYQYYIPIIIRSLVIVTNFIVIQ
jgi:hypothetical protein